MVPSVAQQKAGRQGCLLMISMLVSLLNTEKIGESWRGDLEMQMEVTQHKMSGRGSVT